MVNYLSNRCYINHLQIESVFERSGYCVYFDLKIVVAEVPVPINRGILYQIDAIYVGKLLHLYLITFVFNNLWQVI